MKKKALNYLKSQLEVINQSSFNESFKSVIRGIEKEIDFDEEWETFKYHIEKGYPDFFSKLLKVAPSLTRVNRQHKVD